MAGGSRNRALLAAGVSLVVGCAQTQTLRVPPNELEIAALRNDIEGRTVDVEYTPQRSIPVGEARADENARAAVTAYRQVTGIARFEGNGQSVGVVRGDGSAVSIPLTHVTRISDDHTLLGTGVGGLAGLALGFVVLQSAKSDPSDHNRCHECEGFGRLFLAVATVAAGALVGTVIGGNASVDWRVDRR